MCSTIQKVKEELVEEIARGRRRVVYVSTIIVFPLLAVFLLLMVTLIPRETLQQHMEESAVYLSEYGTYKHPLIDNYISTIVDEAADANLLNIAYFLDLKEPILSVLTCKWRVGENGYNNSFLEAVKEGKPSNSDYSRYWHGSLIFVRPLHVAFSIEQIWYVYHIAYYLG